MFDRYHFDHYRHLKATVKAITGNCEVNRPGVEQLTMAFRALCTVAYQMGLSDQGVAELIVGIEPLPPLPTTKLYEGEVKFFNPHEDKKFGFIVFEDRDIFFHLENGIDVIFDGSPVPAQNCKTSRVPKKGEKLVYVPKEAKKGTAADWWTFADNWHAECAKFETQPIIRMTHRLTGRKCWEGKDLSKLRYMYPMSYHSELSNDVSLYKFEKKVGDKLVEIADPR